MPYIDSNVFIYFLTCEETLPKARAAKAILLKISRGELAASTSTVTWDEVVWIVKRLLGWLDAVEGGKKLLAFPHLNFVDVDRDITLKAQALVERYELSPRDAIQAACAIRAGEREIVSDDSDFDKVKEIKRVPLSQFNP